jgi:UDP-glucose 4-epimerase
MVRLGYRVVVVDDNLPHNREMLPEPAVFVQGSLGDAALLLRIFKEFNFDLVLHTAEISESASRGETPGNIFKRNVLELVQLLEVMEVSKVKNLVFASSGCVYGEGGVRPVNELDNPNPHSAYAHSKLLAEQILNFYASYSGLNVIALRYFGLCGVGEEVRMYNPEFGASILERALDAAQSGGGSGLAIYGDDYTTFDGTNLTDFLHIVDAAAACGLAANKLHTQKGFEVYNVGSGRAYSEKQVASAVAEITGKIFPLEIHPKLKQDGKFLISDCYKIKHELNFIPKFSSLENIIQSLL